jgi:hypothetical protein
MGPANSKFNDRIVTGGDTEASGLGGYQSLKVEDIQEGGFDELGFG